MIRINLYHVLPSDTWAFAYCVPSHKDVIGLVAGLKTRENAQSAALFLSQKLELELQYVA
jgi:hypothetical protein